jgi:hypothetical protein
VILQGTPTDTPKYLGLYAPGMATADPYDGSLTRRIQDELDRSGGPSDQERAQLRRLVERLEGEFRHLIAEPDRRDRTLAFLQSHATRGGLAPLVASPGPLGGTLREIADLSSRLDSSADPSEGFALAESVADRAHQIAHTVEGFLGALDPADAITNDFRRLVGLVSQLIRNSVAKMQAFARLLHVSSFSVTFATMPPQVSVTFTFGGS